MKTLIFSNEIARVLSRKGRKVRSHGTFRAKRHPRSPRLK